MTQRAPGVDACDPPSAAGPRDRILRRLVPLLLLGLAACVPQPASPPEATATAPAPEPDGVATPEAVADGGADGMVEARLPPLDRLDPDVPLDRPLLARLTPGADFAPSRLNGLGAADVTRIFGEPALVRREASAEMWMYRAGDCVLHLFLYPEDGARRVVHAEIHGLGVGRTTPAACVAGLARAADDRGTS